METRPVARRLSALILVVTVSVIGMPLPASAAGEERVTVARDRGLTINGQPLAQFLSAISARRATFPSGVHRHRDQRRGAPPDPGRGALESGVALERLNEEIKRRTRVVRIFPNPASCLRLVLRFRILTSKHPADLRLEARLRSASSWSRERWNPFRRFGLWRQPSSSDNDAAFVSTSGGTQSGNGVSSTRWWPAGVCTSTIWVTERGGHQNGRGRPRVCLNIPWTVAFPLPERKVVRQSWPPTDRSHSVTGSERLVSWP